MEFVKPKWKASSCPEYPPTTGYLMFINKIWDFLVSFASSFMWVVVGGLRHEGCSKSQVESYWAILTGCVQQFTSCISSSPARAETCWPFRRTLLSLAVDFYALKSNWVCSWCWKLCLIDELFLASINFYKAWSGWKTGSEGCSIW